MRRASRALERQPRVTAAMVAAMSAQDETTAPIKRYVNDTLRAIIADAAGGQEVPDLDDVVRTLGAVWFAELTFWVGGLEDANVMNERLARAAELLLDRALPH